MKYSEYKIENLLLESTVEKVDGMAHWPLENEMNAEEKFAFINDFDPNAKRVIGALEDILQASEAGIIRGTWWSDWNRGSLKAFIKREGYESILKMNSTREIFCYTLYGKRHFCYSNWELKRVLGDNVDNRFHNVLYALWGEEGAYAIKHKEEEEEYKTSHVATCEAGRVLRSYDKELRWTASLAGVFESSRVIVFNAYNEAVTPKGELLSVAQVEALTQLEIEHSKKIAGLNAKFLEDAKAIVEKGGEE